MRPLEIAAGSDYEPFGWRTSLGWCVIGAACTAEGNDEASLDDLGTTRIVQGCIAFKTDCREVIVDALEDSEIHMPGMDEKYSVEDAKFMEIMSQAMYQRG